jgi:hypothetical protein
MHIKFEGVCRGMCSREFQTTGSEWFLWRRLRRVQEDVVATDTM